MNSDSSAVTAGNKKTSFPDTEIKNFTDADALDVSSGVHKTCGPLVTLLQRAGSMNFQFCMTPEQAREMAAALFAAADFLDGAA